MAPTLGPERQLSGTGVTVPLIGYGTAPLGKPDVTRMLASSGSTTSPSWAGSSTTSPSSLTIKRMK